MNNCIGLYTFSTHSKDDTSNEWRQGHARTVVAKLRTHFKGLPPDQAAPVRAGVAIAIRRILHEPLLGQDWTVWSLDRELQDDRLLAAMIEWQMQHPDDAVYLVSHDFLALEKAAGRQLQTVDAGDKLTHVERPTADAARRQEMRRELDRLRNRLPKLTLGFLDGDRLRKHVNCPLGQVLKAGQHPSDEDIEHQIEQERKR